MLHRFLPVLALALGVRASEPSEPVTPTSAVITSEIRFNDTEWRRGSHPSLTMILSSGRGFPQKVAAFLYTSEEPGAFGAHPFPPQFVGVVKVPSSTLVLVDRPPERSTVNAHSRERFVQGAIFDVETGTLLGVTNEEYLDIAYDAEPTTYTLDFQTEDDFTTSLSNGQDVTTPPEFGRLVSVSSLQPGSGPQHFGPGIFDTDPSGPNASSSDPDLLVDLGNALILQENGLQTVPGIFDHPDDSANGGSFVFTFDGFASLEKVEPVSIDLIDVDAGSGIGVKVLMTDVMGRNRLFTVPVNWTGDLAVDKTKGFRTLDLTTLAPQPGFSGSATASGAANFLSDEVVRIEVLVGGSGAVDNLVFQREADTVGERSTLTSPSHDATVRKR